MKKTDKNASNAKRSLRTKLAELFGFRRERSLPRSEHGSRHRAAEAGNVFFTLFGAVAVVGVLGAGIMSTMRGPLTTMVEVNRIEETKAQSRMNARLILLEAASNDTHCGSTDDVTGGGAVEFTEAIPFAAGTGPTGGGVIPGGVDGAKNDPWGQAYGYCVWNNGFSNSGCANTLDGQDNLNAPAISIVSGGPDRTITTTCAQAGALNIQGDDIVETLTYSEAVSASGGLWTDSGSTIDSGKALNVTDAVNDSTFGAGASFAGDVTLATGTSVAAPSVSTDVIIPYGAGTTVSVNANTLDVNADGDISGTLTVGGATTISNTLTVTGNISDSAGNLTLDDDVDVTGALDVVGALDVSGSITDTSDNIVTVDDALSVTGAADITGDFAVNTNMFTVDATTGDTVIAGTAELNGKTIIRGDGNDDTTNAFEIWNSDVTPLELMSVDDAGNMAIAGRLLTGGFDETVSIYGTTTDGSTDPLVIYDGAATPVEVFSVNTDGEISIDGAADGNMLIATGTEFSPVAMSGDATISNLGVIDLEAGAVDNDEIADGAVDTDEIADGAVTGAKIGLGVAGAGTYDCLKLDGSNIVTQACGSGGGGDGVGLDGFVDLADTPSAYAGAAADADKLVVVNPTGDGLVFADAATIVPPADRLEDRVDTANAKPVDTYIDVDTTDNGATNSIVFYTDNRLRLTIPETGSPSFRGALEVSDAGHQPFMRVVADDNNNQTGVQANYYLSNNGNSSYYGSFGFNESSDIIYLNQNATGYFDLAISSDGRVALGAVPSEASAKLDVSSTTQGFLAPRLTNAQATTLAAVPPATGLLIFNTEAGDNGIFQFWDGSAWVDVGGGGAATGGLWEPDGSNDFIEYDDTLGGVRIGRVTGQPAPATDWLLDVTNSVVYTTANKVGINSTTISPGLNVDITGNIGATNYCDQDGGDCFSAADIASLSGGGGVDSDRIEDGGDANTYVDADPADDDSTNSIVFFNAGSQSMVVDADGELGIGITDPQSTLHLNTTTPGLGTDMSALNKATAAIRITEGGNELFLDSNTIMNEGSNLLYGVVGAHDLIYYTTAVERMRILSTGAVGINNNSPQTQLDVTGTLRIGDGSELCNVAGHEGALRYVAASDTYQVCANSATGWEDLFATGTGAAGLWTDVGGNRIHYGATGFERVGIATTSPITTLDVNGGVRVGSVSGNAPTYLSLNSLSNVDVPSPANNQILTFNSGSGNWEPYSSSSLVNSVVLNDLSNVNVPSPSDGDVLSYDTATSRWVAVSSVASADTLAGLSCNTNELARWNGTAWVCSTETNVDSTLSLQFTSTGVSGGSFSAVGSSSALGYNIVGWNSALTTLNPTTAVMMNTTGGDTFLTAYSFSGGVWTEISGSRFDTGEDVTDLVIERLSSDTVIIGYLGGGGAGVQAYRWNGTSWSLVATAPSSGYGPIAVLDSTTVVHFDALNNTIRNYSWNGSSFTQINTQAFSWVSNGGKMLALDSETVALVETEISGNTDRIRTLNWNGSSWVQVGPDFDLTAVTDVPQFGYPVFKISSNVIGIQGGSVVYTFSWNGTAWAQSGSTDISVGGGSMTMADADTAWLIEDGDTIRAFDFSATVAASEITDANTTGELDTILNIGDRFLVTRTASNNRVFTVSNIPDANTVQVFENAIDEGPVDADITVLTDMPSSLADLSNVNIPFVSDQQCLVYNASFDYWEAGDCDMAGNTAEWSDDGSGNIYNTDDGNVGIGTSTPTNKLEVLNGSIVLKEDDDGNIAIELSSDNSSGWIELKNAGTNTTYISSKPTQPTYFNAGDVGIGTQTPANELEVAGDIRSDSIILNGVAGDAPTYTVPDIALSDLNNVSAASPTTNDVLSWNGTSWVNTAGGGGGGSIDALSDAAHDSTTDFNLFMGVDAGTSITTGGQYNIAIGQTAADALTTGDSNIAMGHNALGAAVDNQGSVAIGRNAASLSNNTHRLVAIGNNAAQNYNGASWHSIVAIGSDAFTNVTAGAGITAIGNEAMNNFPGDYNTAIGNLTMFASNGGGGNDNIGMGHHTGSYMSGNRNVVIGTEAFKGGFSGDYDHRGNDNVFLGDQSAMNATGNNNDNNIFIGSNTGASLRNGANNILIGYNVDVSSGTAANELNIGNTLYGNLSTDDIGIGTATPSDDLHIYDSTNRGKITIEGADAQQSVIELLTDGDGATNLDDGGAARGWSLYSYNNTWGTTAQRNDFGISYYNGGWQDYLYMDSQNYYVGIFNTAPNVALDVTGDIEYTGTLADVSDIRLKKDIKPLNTDDMIQRILAVDTYTFVMKDDEAGQIEYGVMAQEIEKIFPELVRTANDEMGTKSVNYVGLIAPMIEATKSLKAENEALKAEIEEIKTAQADILEEVKGIARHTGYGIEKGDMMYLLAAMMIMMLSGFGLALVYRRQGSCNNE